MKKFGCFVLCLLMLLTLAACGEKSGSRTVCLLTQETIHNSDDSVQSQYTYEYDDRGNLLKAEFPGAGSDMILNYTFNDQGLLTAYDKVFVIAGNEITDAYEFRYTLKKGMPETCQIFAGEQELYTCTFQVKKGLITRVDYTYPSDISQQMADRWQTYEYDKNGNLLRESFCRSVPYFPELQYSVLQYRYEYDEDSNLKTLIYEFATTQDEISDIAGLSFEQQHIWQFTRNEQGQLIAMAIDGNPYTFTVTDHGVSIPDSHDDWQLDQNGNVTSTGNRTYVYEAITLSSQDADRFDRWNIFLRSNSAIPVGVSELRQQCLPTYSTYHEQLFYYYLIPNPLA